ncbi:MAG: lysophospholipid acyltransferase family protein [Dysgonamonadaceae bacterium]|jgi:KDO2-lipid IV(A) lauroyltransferase|nr:lysophospholipid acyltransferase family protein [Dysgonamonadaceae bacterium]
MNWFLYYIIYALCFLPAILPLRALYFFSDIVFFIVYYVVGYRKKIARKNLLLSFPDKSPQEIRAIEKAFYHQFCDSFFETLKLLNMPPARMKRHFVFKNEELIRYFLKQGKSVVLLLGHFGNWEWAASLALWIKADENTVLGQVYRPLRNKVSDRLFLHIRKSFHSVCFNKYDVYREIVKMQKAEQNWVLGFMSDQKPAPNNPHIWVRFLNRDTAALTGTEKIARHTGAAVCYLDVKKIKRSFYEGKIKLITDNPAETQEFEITRKYMELLEKTVLRDPACYLWTHNRWKHKKPDS